MTGTLLALKDWAKHGPADDVWLWAIGLLVAALVGFVFSFITLQRKRVIEDTPTSKIRSAAQGYVELIGIGQLMEGQPIVAPLTGTICTWYDYKIEEHRQSGKNSRWVTIRSGTSEELFLIKDDTGQSIIDPEGANVTVANKDVWHGSEANPTGSPLSDNKKTSFFSGLGRHRRYRYTEKRLHTDESLYAIGLYKTVGGAGAKLDINEDVRELVREWKSDTASLMEKYDTNNDGVLDLNEWQKVRDTAYNHVVEKHSEQKTLPPINIMNNTNDRRRPFILSAIEQNDLIKRLHIYSVLSLSLFILCGSFSTWFISIRLAA
jgi:E3 Ubiquitin ligase